MSDVLNICSPCGACCDGTLVGFVQLNNHETSKLKDLLVIEDTHNKGFFLQPCTKYCNKGCTIYSQRPKQCANFNCSLLKSFEHKELDYNTAVDIITSVKQKRSSIQKKIVELDIKLRSKSFHFQMAELKNILQKKKEESSLDKNHLTLISELKFLNQLLTQQFGVSLH